MSSHKLIHFSNKKLNLKYDGTYDKFKVAKNIALAVNQAKAEGFSLNTHSWKSAWNKTLSKWVLCHDHNWCSILAAVLMYSNCTFNGSKIEAVAYILGVEKEWIIGFYNTLNGSYKSISNEICKRKSIKGQHCRDGKEFGKLFKLAYLPENFFQFSFSSTTKNCFNSHQWELLEEYKIILSIGINYDNSIKKCKECSMYGAFNKNYVCHNDNIYFINEIWDDLKYKHNNELNLTCNEIIIKKLLS